ncbi:MAG TPA: class I tRNA ligase family protein, partial [Silvibacterium sp.]|nr:class I tRNA ligase family protein [Silvibacterium sp.]
EAANAVYRFFWGDFCDWYLEMVKLRLDFAPPTQANSGLGWGTQQRALTTLLQVFEASLRLLSPFMPFITEELWHALYDGQSPAKSIALTRYPQADATHINADIERHMLDLQLLINAIRAARKSRGIEERERLPIKLVDIANNVNRSLPTDQKLIIERLTRSSEIDFVTFGDYEAGKFANLYWQDGFHATPIAIVYEKKIDVGAERERLKKKLDEYERVLLNAEKQLENQGFLAKAPEQLIAKLRKQAQESAALRQETLEAIERLEELV